MCIYTENDTGSQRNAQNIHIKPKAHQQNENTFHFLQSLKEYPKNISSYIQENTTNTIKALELTIYNTYTPTIHKYIYKKTLKPSKSEKIYF